MEEQEGGGTEEGRGGYGEGREQEGRTRGDEGRSVEDEGRGRRGEWRRGRWVRTMGWRGKDKGMGREGGGHCWPLLDVWIDEERDG